MTKEENKNEEEAIEDRVLEAYQSGEISKKLYYSMAEIGDILKALIDGEINKKLYLKLLGCQEAKHEH